MSNQLRVLMSDRTFTTSAGEVTLKPFKFKQFPVALGIVEQYLKILSSFGSPTEIINELLSKTEDCYTILGDVVKLLDLVSNIEAAVLDECQYDEVIGLLAEVIDMNLDFFSRIGQTLKSPPDKEETSLKTGELKSVA